MMQRLSKLAAALALGVAVVAAPQASYAGVFISLSVNFGPPALPVYVQPPCPDPDWEWTPGYWSYGPYGYYWVPGTWVPAPVVGYYWTPGYWGFYNDAYVWHGGYWGPQVGFYGGINYGFGYFGNGFYGGNWSGRHFRYNTAYVNVNRTYIHNVYINRTVVNNYYGGGGARVSYNGGPHGIAVRPTADQIAYGSRHHLAPTNLQWQHIHAAAVNRNYYARVNHGRPSALAFSRPLGVSHRPTNFAPLAATHARPAFHASTVHAYHAAPAVHTYHAPAVHTYHAAPMIHTYHAPAVHTYHAPAVHTYHAPPAVHVYHAAPMVHTYHAAPAVHTYHAAARPAPHGGGDKEDKKH